MTSLGLLLWGTGQFALVVFRVVPIYEDLESWRGFFRE